jgi:acyl-CoA reductase-like NAD-dependent aldehyde dehydrogenase
MHPIVRQIIDRDCHVGMSYRAVMRHVISRLKDGYQTFQALPAADRKELLRQCRDRHRENRELYVAVMYPDYKPVEEDD